MNYPFLSIIIPCRNEEKYIGQCLDSVVANDYPKDRFEVLVVDGMSEDGTRGIVERYAQWHPFIRLLENPKKIFPIAMNIGIKNATGEIIMVMSAHSIYEEDYISNCVKFLHEYNADNVGGVLITVPSADTLVAKSIALSLSHPFGTLSSYFRIGTKEPKWVDTAAFGCYKKEVFETVGLYNENLVRSSDMDFNVRLRKRGGKILLDPDIVCYYYAQPNLKGFWKQIFQDGVWAIYPLKFGSRVFGWRHLAPIILLLIFVSLAVLTILSPIFLWLLLGMLGVYFLGVICSSIQIAAKEKNFRYLFTMPIVFAVRHVGYGLGSLVGLVKVLTSQQFWKKW